ncbi:mucin-5AC [Rhynchocyon petersi]
MAVGRRRRLTPLWALALILACAQHTGHAQYSSSESSYKYYPDLTPIQPGSGGSPLDGVTIFPPMKTIPVIRALNPAHNGRVCSTWGNFHFKTFDGDIFQFPGLCNYVFSSNCRATYEDFNIQVRRSQGPNGTVPSRVVMKLDGMVLQLTKSSVLVNDHPVQLPFSRSGVLIEQNGMYLKVAARLGLVFMWNLDNSLLLELDDKYANQTCGLCGDFNGVPVFNEFFSNNIKLTPVEYGNLQKLDGPMEQCQDPAPVPLRNCTPGLAFCEGTLLGQPFSGCHALVDASSYIAACQQDVCLCADTDPTSCACPTLAEYSRQCVHAGGVPQEWRTSNLCPAQGCPFNMEHRECGLPCADTCSNLEHAQLCEDHCISGCFCPEGMVFDDINQSGCVPEAQCSCTYNGLSYPPGAVYSTDCTNCTCSGGRWNCQETPCPGTCSVLGGAHFSTFDEKQYTVHGDCSYVLAKPCDGGAFTVLAELRKCGLTDSETCLKSVTLSLSGGQTVIVVKASGEVFVNQIYTQLPISAANVTLFRPSTFFIIAQTNLGLQLDIQLVPTMQVFLRLAPTLQGLTCGLCGNFNNIQADDFRTISGVVEGTAAAFFNTWKTQASCPNVKNNFEDPCSLSVENEKYAQHWCSLLTDTEGPFASCHATVNPATYYSNCMFDTCNCEKSEDCLCASLSAYVRTCAIKGIQLQGWRDSVCAKPMMSCPKSLTYQDVVNTCQPTCRSLSEEDVTCHISFVPVDGCVCANGTFLDDLGKCVPVTSCPCYYRGSVVPNGESVHDSGTVCTCTKGKLTCIGDPAPVPVCVAPMVYFDCRNATPGAAGAGCQKSCHTLDMACYSPQCVSGCVCPDGLVSDGEGGCIAEADCPCVHNEASYKPGQTVHVGCNTCTCKNRMWQCTQEPCLATCAVYGDGHYLTFDGQRFTFEGDCEYTLVQDHCGSNGSSQGSFRVVTENIPCGTTGTTCSKAIKIFLGSYELKLSGGKVEVIEKGTGQAVPYSIRYMGIYLVVDTDVGLVLQWDKKTSLFLRLSPEFKGKVCGLCGNFDGNAINDFTTRSHLVVSDVLEFGNSWKFSPSCPDALAPRDPCTANPYRKSWAQKQCSILHSATFATCHAHVEPTKYYEACVSDACACDSGGDCECFCTAVAAYAQACQDAGVCVSWRSPEVCPLFCDYYNPNGECEWHYQPCGAPCMQTCRNPSGHCLHDVHGLEGCYPKCPPETPIFDEDEMQCVAQCSTPPPPPPCRVRGKDYRPGAVVPSSENCHTCVCTESGVKCAYDADACVCTYGGQQFHPGDVIYHTADGTGSCITARCVANGTIERGIYSCDTSTAPTTTFSFSTTSNGQGVDSGDFDTLQNLREHGFRVCQTPKEVKCRAENMPDVPLEMLGQHVECSRTCTWTKWFDVDFPSSGPHGGDVETYDNIIRHGEKVCHKPQDITQLECRAENHPEVSIKQLGQVVECNPDVGLVCRNQDQVGKFKMCLNYEIRPSKFCSYSYFNTTDYYSCNLCCTWTKWFDVDFPSSGPHGGDVETYDNIIRHGEKVCHKPQDITQLECRAENHPEVSIKQLGQVVECNRDVGLVCRNQDQPFDSDRHQLTREHHNCVYYLKSCCYKPLTHADSNHFFIHTCYHLIHHHSNQNYNPFNYPYLFNHLYHWLFNHVLKPSKFCSYSYFNTTDYYSCNLYCTWTKWFDVDFPSSGPHGGDVETYDNIIRHGEKVCHKPQDITQLECRAENHPEVSIKQLGQVVECNRDVGLVCRNQDQVGKFKMCLNYEIRVLCCQRPFTHADSNHFFIHTCYHLIHHHSNQNYNPFNYPYLFNYLYHWLFYHVLKPSKFCSYSYFNTTDYYSCNLCCTWTKWFDVDFPSSGPHGGDVETYENIIRHGEKVCHKPQDITQLECRAENYPEVSIKQLGQVVECNRDVGLVCHNQDQVGKFKMCLNYEIRCSYDYSYSSANHHLNHHPYTHNHHPYIHNHHPHTHNHHPHTHNHHPHIHNHHPHIHNHHPYTHNHHPYNYQYYNPSNNFNYCPSNSNYYPYPTSSYDYSDFSCTWTKWFDVDFPSSGPHGGDVETYDNIIRHGEKVCHKPQDITQLECRAENHPEVSIKQLGQVVECNRDVGLVCRNQDQVGKFKMCLNYEIRVLCCERICSATNCITHVNKKHCWKNTYYHLIHHHFNQNYNPFNYPYLFNHLYHWLFNHVLKPSKFCSYSYFNTTDYYSCNLCCTWTKWFDVDFPSSGPHGGDVETYDNIIRHGEKVCHKPQDITQLECRAENYPEVSIKQLGQVLECNRDVGLVCRNQDQVGKFKMCLNYEIRNCITHVNKKHCWKNSYYHLIHHHFNQNYNPFNYPYLFNHLYHWLFNHVLKPSKFCSYSYFNTTDYYSCNLCCTWTKWFDVDFPSSGPHGGDVETYDNIIRHGEKVCHKPQDITQLECRAENHPEVSIKQLGQVVECNRDVGLVCRNQDQVGKFKMCLNYEIRVLCCQRPLTHADSNHFFIHTCYHLIHHHSNQNYNPFNYPYLFNHLYHWLFKHAHGPSKFCSYSYFNTTDYYSCNLCCTWTKWFDVDFPSSGPHGGDVETYDNIIRHGEKVCHKPQDITQLECRAENYPEVSIKQLGQVVECNRDVGLVCRNQDQVGKFKMCLNYEIRVLCCQRCTWTKWFDVDFPSSGPHGGDVETYDNIIRHGEKVCHKPQDITQLECRAENHPEVSIKLLGQVVECNPDVGLVCRNQDQADKMCFNYEIRVLCCDHHDGCPSTSISPSVTYPTLPTSSPESKSVITPTPPNRTTGPCYCIVLDKLYPAGSTIYQETDLDGHCYSAYCTQDCQVVRHDSHDCSSTPQTPPTPAPTTVLSSSHSPDHRCSDVIPPRKKGETWNMPNCTQATCEGHNVITLHPRKCPPTKALTCANGYPAVKVVDEDGCCPHDECQCVCSGWGDPHYITFDGTYYTFLDNCTYVLMQQIVPRYGHLRVLIDNYFCNAEDGLSCPRSIIIEYQQDRIVMTRKPGGVGIAANQVFFNGKEVQPGFRSNGIVVSQLGIKMYVSIPGIGLQVMFTGLIFSVEVPFSKFTNNTEGQCGTCTNNQKDDCRLPDGAVVASCSEMSNHWRVTNPDQPSCHGPPPTPLPTTPTPTTTEPTPCPVAPVCQLVLSDVFKQCHKVIPPLPYYEGCVFDQCHVTDPDVMCSSLELYASLCASQGACIDWRGHTNHTCSFTCPANKVYQSCGPVSQTYCYGNNSASVLALQDTGSYMEGCFCPLGMTLFSESSDVCVPSNNCFWCLGPNGQPVEPGQTVIDNCQECVCDGNTQSLVCQPQPCPLPPSCYTPGHTLVPVPLQTGQCCAEYQCVCNASLCPQFSPCPNNSHSVSSHNDADCCPSQKCVLDVCVINGSVYKPGAVVSSSLCETCRCQATEDPEMDPYVICDIQICEHSCPLGSEYRVPEGQCCGFCVPVACVVNASDGSAHLFYPGETWSEPGNLCETHECEKYQDGLMVVTTRKSCPPLNCPKNKAKLSEDGCCLFCPTQQNQSTCAVHYKEEVIRERGCSSAQPVLLAYCRGNCGDTSSMYSFEANMVEHTCRCCQELRTSLRNVTLSCRDGSSRTLSYRFIEDCGCEGPKCPAQGNPGHSESWQSEEEKSQETRGSWVH